MTENNIDDLRKARYMSLSCPPASPEAKVLVEPIINIITKSAQRQRARKANEVPAFKSAVGLIIGDLLIGFHTREAGWSYLSMSTSAFSDRPVGYKTFKPIMETMEAIGLIVGKSFIAIYELRWSLLHSYINERRRTALPSLS